MASSVSNIKVSIVTPSYNQGQFIEATILSVLNQSYKNIEYILVDGGSNDDTMAVVERYRGKIDIVIHEKDKGQSDAINKGFKLATGTLVGWINSDDVLYPDCVKDIVQLYEQHRDGSIFYASSLDFLDEPGNVTETIVRKIPNKNFLINTDYDVIQQGSFYSTDILKKINYCDQRLNFCMDLDLWLRLLDHGNIYSINDKPLAGFRRWENAKTSASAYKFLAEIKTLLKKNGMKTLSAANRRLNWYMFKIRTKAMLMGNK